MFGVFLDAETAALLKECTITFYQCAKVMHTTAEHAYVRVLPSQERKKMNLFYFLNLELEIPHLLHVLSSTGYYVGTKNKNIGIQFGISSKQLSKLLEGRSYVSDIRE